MSTISSGFTFCASVAAAVDSPAVFSGAAAEGSVFYALPQPVTAIAAAMTSAHALVKLFLISLYLHFGVVYE